MDPSLLKKVGQMSANLEFVDGGGAFEEFDPTKWGIDDPDNVVSNNQQMAIGDELNPQLDGNGQPIVIDPNLNSPSDGETNSGNSQSNDASSQGDDTTLTDQGSNITDPAGDTGISDDQSTTKPGYVKLTNGVEVPLSVVENYWNLDQRIASDPGLAARFQQAFLPAGVQQFVPQQQVQQPVQQQQVQLPVDLPGFDPNDLDPVNQYMLQQLQLIQAQNQQIALQSARENQARIDAEVVAGVNQWEKDYATGRGLDTNQIQLIKNEAARLNLISVNMTGKNLGAQPATVEALEQAFWSIPAFRDDMLSKAGIQNNDVQAGHQARQKKLAALNGGGGTTPRVPELLTKAQRTPEAMAQELEQMLSQS